MINKLISKLEQKSSQFVIETTNIINWFLLYLDLFFAKDNILYYNQWDILYIELWLNIWSELSKPRPCLVFSDSIANRWDTIIILPIKTYKWKLPHKFCVMIDDFEKIWLKNKSYISITDIRSISKKRITRNLWKIDIYILKSINRKIEKIFNIRKMSSEDNIL